MQHQAEILDVARLVTTEVTGAPIFRQRVASSALATWAALVIVVLGTAPGDQRNHWVACLPTDQRPFCPQNLRVGSRAAPVRAFFPINHETGESLDSRHMRLR